jgi:hypothetical protein
MGKGTKLLSQGDLASFFIGRVTNNTDPDRLGRIKVFVKGVNDDSLESPDRSDDLPFCYPAPPAMFGSDYRQGTFSLPEVGADVFVFFYRGDIDFPYYCFTIPGIKTEIINGQPSARPVNDDPPDWHPLARGVDPGLIPLPDSYEPPLDFGAKYPENDVISNRTHSMEFDATKGAERIQLTHLKKSYIKMGKSGEIVLKATEKRFDVTVDDAKDWVGGDREQCTVGDHDETIEGSRTVSVVQDETESIGGDETRNVTGEHTETIGGDQTQNVTGVATRS